MESPALSCVPEASTRLTSTEGLFALANDPVHSEVTSFLSPAAPVMDDLNDILVFARVAELGSFTSAAQRLALPKSTVSERVARLEARLGARLLERSTRKLRLTEVGQRYLEHARRAFLELEQGTAAVERSLSEPAGVLRVSAPVVLGQVVLPSIVAEYVAQFPQVRLFVDLSNRRVDLFGEGFDVVLRAGTLPDSELVARRLGRAAARLYAAPAYLARRGLPETPQELAGHGLLECASQASANHWMLQHDDGREPERVEARFAVITNDAATLQMTAVSGHGIASLPTFAARAEVSAGRLRPVLPAWSTRQFDIHAIVPSRKSVTPAVRAFIDLVGARIAQGLAGH
jgi:DNA-binding transcriptional LysR family regulator